ncbi:MAG TPA: extracellular solute-binding protein, partial [Bacillota bacterium]|nr:extracellular solute-binding protein [Bacillota bacterium]
IGSTAGVSFFSPMVTYADNTTEPAELAILPYPVFEYGKKVAIQRGAGMSVIKSTEQREQAAAIFLKWFTSPENNLHFVSQTGYLPVTVEAFGEIMAQEIANIPDANIKKLLATCRLMQEEYQFCTAPLFDGVDQWQAQYENRFKEIAAASREAYREQLQRGSDPAKAYEAVSRNVFETFIREFNN